MRIFFPCEISVKSLSYLIRHRLRLLLLISFCGFILILLFILKWEREGDEAVFENLNLDIPKDFQPVLVTHREAFPSSGPNKIPKIIHQTWKDKHIPNRLTKWIKSWLHHHPDWEYWLWTDDSAEQLIADKYPHLLDIYNGYAQPIRRADALRYVILYEYGGVYADMDMEALTPLDPLLLKYSCFIGQEPYEHPILDTNFEQLLINALMGCRKGHPFFKMLLDNLPDYSHLWHFLDSAGPHFVTSVFHKYVKESMYSPQDLDYLYVTPSEYFYPKMDPNKISHFYKKCQNVGSLSKLQLKACRNLKFKYTEKLFGAISIAFTDHHWVHTYVNSEFFLSHKYTDIYDLIPSVNIYKSLPEG